ncbi:MAG: hypothetical protein ACR2KP_09785 [Egibacteraceae bacterium]
MELWPDLVLPRQVARAWRECLHTHRGVDPGEPGRGVQFDV